MVAGCRWEQRTKSWGFHWVSLDKLSKTLEHDPELPLDDSLHIPRREMQFIFFMDQLLHCTILVQRVREVVVGPRMYVVWHTHEQWCLEQTTSSKFIVLSSES